MSDFLLIRDGLVAFKRIDREWHPYAPCECDISGFYTRHGFVIPATSGCYGLLSMLTRRPSFEGIVAENHEATGYMIDHYGLLQAVGFRRRGKRITETKGAEALPVRIFARGNDKDEAELMHYAMARTASMDQTLELLDKTLAQVIRDNVVIMSISTIVDELNKRFPLEQSS